MDIIHQNVHICMIFVCMQTKHTFKHTYIHAYRGMFVCLFARLFVCFFVYMNIMYKDQIQFVRMRAQCAICCRLFSKNEPCNDWWAKIQGFVHRCQPPKHAHARTHARMHICTHTYAYTYKHVLE